MQRSLRILSVLGARPQFIKSAPVSLELRRRGVQEYRVHTGQHYDSELSRLFFDELELGEPDVNLGIGSGSHADQTGRMLMAIEDVIAGQTPDWVLVYGDTNSTLAGALAAAKLHVPVAHVEAGLRSFNRSMPEEVNRIVADAVAELLLAPTQAAVSNLKRMGVAEQRVLQTGDVMYDATLIFRDRARARSRILERLGLEPRQYVLATVHRSQNTDDRRRLETILEGLAEVQRHMRVVLPLHPRTLNALDSAGLSTGGVDPLEPVGFLDMIRLESNAALIATDSGGVQREAFFHNVPSVILREETEWTELVNGGWSRLVPPTSATAIRDSVIDAIGTSGDSIAPYGDGTAAAQIATALLDTQRRITSKNRSSR